jgi:hypothetical protein
MVLVATVAACSDSGRRSSSAPTAPSAVAAVEGATKTATEASGEAIADAVTGAPGPSGRGLSGSRNVSQAVEFPPRDGTLQFRQQLEAAYRDALGRSPSASFVDIEGTIVWTQEYLRYRVNGCGHQDAITRVAAQIQGRGIQPICVDFTGTTVSFPPRNEPFAFRQELERIYRDELRRTAVQTFVDAEGDIVWTQEYLRYRLNGCAQTEATDRVLSQVTGGPIQPVCSSPGPPTPPITSIVPTVTAPGATTTLVNSPRPNAGAGPIITVSNNNGSLITLTASSPVDRLIVSVNTTATADARLSPFVVLNSYYELRFASPQTTIVLTVQGVGSFNLEFAASLGGGPLGPYRPQPFTAPATTTLQIVYSPNPIPWAVGGPRCGNGPNEWAYDTIFTETGGVGVTMSAVETVADGIRRPDVAFTLAIPARAVRVTQSGFCFASSGQHTIQQTYRATEASGRALTIVAPTLILLPRP